MSRTIRLVGTRQREWAKQCIDQAPDGFVVKIAEETRSDRQNRRLHAMLGDLRKQVPEFMPYSIEDMKARFMDALGAEMRYLPKLEGVGLFPVAQRTSTLSVSQFSALIELLFIAGAKHGVVWTDPAEREHQARAA